MVVINLTVLLLFLLFLEILFDYIFQKTIVKKREKKYIKILSNSLSIKDILKTLPSSGIN